MKKKFPIEEHDISIGKKSSAFFKFDFGDLGVRKNVDNYNEISIATERIHNFFVDHNMTNNNRKFSELNCLVSYMIPNEEQYQFFLKNKRYKKDYGHHTENYLNYNLFNYSKKNKQLQVQSAFLELSQPHTLSLITENLEEIDKIGFYNTGSDCDLFPDSEEFQYSPFPKYITNFLGHKKWFNHDLIIDEQFYKEGLYKNNLDDLVEARKFVDPKIKFEILGANEKEKKCFDFAGLF